MRLAPPTGFLLVFAATVLAFHSALENQFVNWDDTFWIVGNPHLRDFNWENFQQWFTTFPGGAYTPLSQLTLALDGMMWRNKVWGVHCMNVVWHGLTAGLVFLVARRLIARVWSGKESDASVSQGGALAAALLFALHPLRVESVAWACERRDVLSGFFALAAVFAYVRYADALRSGETAKRWMLMAGVFFVGGLMSKKVVVTLPVVFCLMDYHPFRRWGNDRDPIANDRPWLEKLPWFLVALMAGGVAVYGQFEAGNADDFRVLGVGERVCQSLAANLHYVCKLAWPFDLNPLYERRQVYGWTHPQVWLGLGLTVGMAAGLWIRRQRYPGALVAWMSYQVIILPFLGFFQSGPQFAADRFTYLASVPLAIWAGGALQFIWDRLHSARTAGRWRSFLAGGVVVLLAGLGWQTHVQCGVWRNSVTLWEYVVKLDPESRTGGLNLGEVLARRMELKPAAYCFRRAVRLEPGAAAGWYNLACVDRAMGRWEEAIVSFRQAIANDPADFKPREQLGKTFLQMHRYAEALFELRLAAKLAPESGSISSGLGLAYEGLGEEKLALGCFKKAMQGGVSSAGSDWKRLAAKVYGEAGPLPGSQPR